MVLKRNVEKLNEYFARLAEDKTRNIKPGHMEKVIGKLRGKEHQMLQDQANSTKNEKMQRLQAELAFVCDQIERIKWLLREIGNK